MRATKKYSRSGAQWASSQESDLWVQTARKLGYQCRSALKLVQMDEKYHIFSPKATQCVIDVGCNPGSWMQVAASRTRENSTIIGVDRIVSAPVRCVDLGIRSVSVGPSHHLRNVEDQHPKVLISGDITEESTQGNVKDALQACGSRANVLLSDIAPDCSGDKIRDFYSASKINTELVYFLKFHQILSKGGHFICKTLGGHEYSKHLLDTLRHNFENVHLYKPIASRASSSEQYVVALHFHSRSAHKPNSGSLRESQQRFGLDSWPGLARRRPH